VPIFNVLLRAGGRLFSRNTLGPEWREYRLPFEELRGVGRFQPQAFEGLALNAGWEQAGEVQIWLDDIAAYGDRNTGPERPIFTGDPSVGWVPVTWLSPNERTDRESGMAGIWTFDATEEVWLSAFYTCPMTSMRGNATSSLTNTRTKPLFLGSLTTSLRGFTRLRVTIRMDPSTPLMIAKFFLAEDGGEQFILLRDAPAKFEDIDLPFAEFYPDAARNLKVAPDTRNGVLDLDRVRFWGVELIPTTEDPFRGKLYVKGAWAVRR
jgi:hypothetical protein